MGRVGAPQPSERRVAVDIGGALDTIDIDLEHHGGPAEKTTAPARD
jgi:hypothetical protein